MIEKPSIKVISVEIEDSSTGSLEGEIL